MVRKLSYLGVALLSFTTAIIGAWNHDLKQVVAFTSVGLMFMFCATLENK